MPVLHIQGIREEIHFGDSERQLRSSLPGRGVKTLLTNYFSHCVFPAVDRIIELQWFAYRQSIKHLQLLHRV